MGKLLNSKKASMLFKEDTESTYFVDKTALLDELLPIIDPNVQANDSISDGGENRSGRSGKYICITRLCRFGKSVAANMIAAYWGKGGYAPVFDRLAVSSRNWYQAHINQHNVIHIAFNSLPADCVSYRQYIRRISRRLMIDLMQAYPNAGIQEDDALWDALNDILELKVDETPGESLRQIRDKQYALKFEGKMGEESTGAGGGTEM